jgi:hypothetical protein
LVSSGTLDWADLATALRAMGEAPNRVCRIVLAAGKLANAAA